MSAAEFDPEYEPSLKPEEIELLKRWHERAYSSLRYRRAGKVRVLGLELDVPTDVFPPTPLADLLGSAILNEVRPTDRVLDMGTGSGINAILAASVASEVVGVDVNPLAVETARANAEHNGLNPKTTFFESDVFEAVTGSFDLIIFDPPFRWLKPRDMLERSIADEGYRTLTRFMHEARRYLTPNGRMLIFFGTSGDLAYLRRLIEVNGFAAEVVGSRELHQEDVTVSYFTFLLT